jgi:hypothetical protein
MYGGYPLGSPEHDYVDASKNMCNSILTTHQNTTLSVMLAREVLGGSVKKYNSSS